MTRELSIHELTLTCGKERLCHRLSFSVVPREVTTLMGPSGSGKSTILSWISGALSPAFKAEGTLTLGDESLHNRPIEERGIAILFQDDLLFPHMNVFDNLLFALGRGPQKSRVQGVRKALAEMGLQELEKRFPGELSGGQKARISLMRALLSKPDAVLLDEPFSKLDKPLRKSFRSLVFDTIWRMEIPALLVTHYEDDVPENGRIIKLGGFAKK